MLGWQVGKEELEAKDDDMGWALTYEFTNGEPGVMIIRKEPIWATF